MLSAANIPDRSELGSDGNEGVLLIPPNHITGASPSDGLMS